MNKERPYREQAEKLRQKIDIDPFEEGEVVEREELPPRSRVHLQKRKKNKWKLKYPVIRLLVLFFILLPITIFSIYSSLLERSSGDATKIGGESSGGFEVIDIERPKPVGGNEEEQDQSSEDRDEFELWESEEKESEEVEQTSEDSSASSQETQSTSIDSLVSDTKSGTKDIIYHKVKSGETIFRISMKYYHSKAGIDMIKSANILTNNDIRVGQVLTIPLSK
jgi:LysM repeat protein